MAIPPVTLPPPLVLIEPKWNLKDTDLPDKVAAYCVLIEPKWNLKDEADCILLICLPY